MVGFENATNITLEQVTGMLNATRPMEMMININETVYGGWFYFVLLFIFWIILLFAALQGAKERGIIKVHDILVFAMYSGTIVSILSFFLRAIFIVREGITYGLINDFQLWMFPILTIVLATIGWATRDI